MFYSHEVLTSSKYGVATVWLVATLGSDSARRKVNRAEILKVDVPKACETITSSETPLALRLQSNLLYGVSKVYSQQCSFVLIDAEHARTQVRNAMNALRTSTTVASKGYVAKRDQITMVPDTSLAQDVDGDYMPGLSDLRHYDTENAVIHDSLFTVESIMSQPYSADEASQQLEFPSDEQSAAIDLYMVSPALRSSLSASHPSHIGSHLFAALEGRVLDDVGLNVDEDGNIYERLTEHGGDDDGYASNQKTAAAETMNETMLEDYMLPGEEAHLELLGQAQPFSPRGNPMSSELTPAPPSTEDSSSTVAAALSRALHKTKTLQLDTQTEMTKTELGTAARKYAANMLHASSIRYQRGGIALARQNAHFWVLGSPVRPGESFSMTMPSQLRIFTGVAILGTLERIDKSHTPASKRASDSNEDGRRVRARLNETEVAHRDDNDHMVFPDEDLLIQDEGSPEMGREPGTPLVDHRSSIAMHMPWNVSSTLGSSAARHHSAGPAGIGSSTGGVSIGLRGSSVAASPLAGRSMPAEGVHFEELVADEDDAAQQEHADGDQNASWLRGSQDPDARNFLLFIREVIDGEVTRKVAFETLLPPGEHDRVVAAHGLMHVLNLAGQGGICVHQAQDQPFRPVEILLS